MSLESVIGNILTALLPALILSIFTLAVYRVWMPRNFAKQFGKINQETGLRIIIIFLLCMIIVLVIFNLFPSVKDLMPIQF